MKIKPCVFFVLILIAALSSGPVFARTNIQQVEMVVGSMQTHHLGEVIRVAVAQEEILSARLLDNGEVLFSPKKAGQTQITIWTRGERQHRFHVTVLSQNIQSRLAELRLIYRDFSNLHFRSQGEQIIAEGRLNEDDFNLFNERISDQSDVISMVRQRAIDFRPMVDIEVKVMELNTDLTRQLGISWSNEIDGPSIGYIRNFRTNNQFVVPPRSGTSFDAGEVISRPEMLRNQSSHLFAGVATAITSTIHLMQEDGDARILAEPFLSTRSGSGASFLAGGTIPIRFDEGVMMHDYGIVLEIEPVADDDGMILTQVFAELSTIDLSYDVDGIPGILRRNTSSQVNIQSGETIVISGLLTTEDSQSFRKVPFLGDIPILGELFKSRHFNQGRSELVILLTPRIRESNDRYHEGIAQFEERARNVRHTGDITRHLVH